MSNKHLFEDSENFEQEANESLSENSDLTAKEKAALRALRQEIAPSENLEEKTVAALNKEGLLNQQLIHSSISPLRMTLAAAATFAIFFLGFSAGKWQPAATVSEKPLFALFLYEAPQLPAGLDEMALVAEYGQWIGDLQAKGRFGSGEKLKLEGRLLRQAGQQLNVATLPETDAQEILSGYFLIEAENLAAAQAIASTCPHLKYNGSIELRELEKL